MKAAVEEVLQASSIDIKTMLELNNRLRSIDDTNLESILEFINSNYIINFGPNYLSQYIFFETLHAAMSRWYPTKRKNLIKLYKKINIFDKSIDFFIKTFESLDRLNNNLENSLKDSADVFIAIKTNDCDNFIKIVSQTNLDLNHTVCNHSLSEVSKFIELAAFFGSIDIFKFLLLQNVEITEKLLPNVIIGGNYEIFHLVEEKIKQIVINDRENLHTAIRYHQNEIAQYLISKYDMEITKTEINLSISEKNISFLFDNISNFVNEENAVESFFIYAIGCNSYFIANILFQIIEKDDHCTLFHILDNLIIRPKLISAFFLEKILKNEKYNHYLNNNILERLTIDKIKTILCDAIEHNIINFVKIICDRIFFFEASVILTAMLRGRYEIMEYFLELDKIPPMCFNSSQGYLKAPLGSAIIDRNLKFVNLLCKSPKIDLNLKNDDDPLPPIILAISYYDKDILTFLVSLKNININITEFFFIMILMGDFGKTALQIAADECNTEAVQILLTRDEIDVNVKDFRGRTPLHTAVSYGEMDIVKLLCSHKNVNINISDLSVRL